MSVTDINTRVAAAVAAIDSGDYTTALTKLRTAAVLLAALPDTTGPGSSNLQWDRAAIQQMIAEVQQAQAASANSSTGGIRRTKMNYVNPCEDSDYD